MDDIRVPLVCTAIAFVALIVGSVAWLRWLHRGEDPSVD